MATRNDIHPHSKVYYRPIEAAIRWSGLVRHEQRILDVLRDRRSPAPDDFPRWPTLHLNFERLYDAIMNKELPHAINGIAVHDGSPVNDAVVTIRHVDLKAWMARYYPDQRPPFLFSNIERQVHPVVTIETVNALVVERDALRSQLNGRDREMHQRRAQSDTSAEALTARAETAYLHTVGGLLTLLLGQSPSGQPYSSFRTQESIISAMVAHHGGRLGISERTLEQKFAAAKRSLSK